MVLISTDERDVLKKKQFKLVSNVLQEIFKEISHFNYVAALYMHRYQGEVTF